MTEPDELESSETNGRLIIKAVVTRKDGTVEDLGVVSEGWVRLDANS